LKSRLYGKLFQYLVIEAFAHSGGVQSRIVQCNKYAL